MSDRSIIRNLSSVDELFSGGGEMRALMRAFRLVEESFRAGGQVVSSAANDG